MNDGTSSSILPHLPKLAVPFSQFLKDFQTLVSLAAANFHEFRITDDFNLQLHDNQNSHANQFLSVLDSSNLVQLVTFPTNCDEFIFDLIITTADSSLPKFLTLGYRSPSDHFPVFSQLSIQPSPPYSLLTKISFTCFHAISIPHFVCDIFSYFHSSSPIFSFRTCLLL
jgi:hypothetical protein